ncbi:ubiquitin recognition factor in ER-associated degradation protein 1-like isoform X2 [Asterias amurensis]|uniref:ubiquitin recognition factor in ER-associated degradation protein 1-like isoform X2 n=1 Tax=Asterias amurensis TaxID=7602 RepID=UPI003AB374A8
MFGFQMFGAFPQTFNKQYRCYSVSMLTGTYRQDVERGGKIIMPPSALDVLTRQNIDYPMLFKLTHKKMERVTHCGVLEFVADEGKVYLPYWMMKNLFLDEGDLLNVESCSLSVATYSKFEPQSVDFLDITNPKAVLENILRGFACLTKGDMIAINYNNKVEFAAPIGYVEPQRHRPAEQDPEEMQVDGAGLIDTDQFMAFQGQGNRLDGKKKNVDSKPVPLNATTIKRGIPNYDYKKGTITFIRTVRPSVTNGTNGEDVPDFEAFKGEGQQLRKKNKKK